MTGKSCFFLYYTIYFTKSKMENETNTKRCNRKAAKIACKNAFGTGMTTYWVKCTNPACKMRTILGGELNKNSDREGKQLMLYTFSN